MALPDDGNRYEIVDGKLVMMPKAGMEHGYLAAFLEGAIGRYVG